MAKASVIMPPMQIPLKSTPILRSLTLLVVCAGIAACSQAPVSRAPVKQSRPAPVVQPLTSVRLPEATATALSQPAATSPWDNIARAQQATGNDRYTLMLDAIEGFLDLNQSATARTLLEQLEAVQLPPDLYILKQILLARSHFIAENYTLVERILNPLTATQGLDRDNAAAILLLRARSLAATGNPAAALRILLAREPLLDDAKLVEENQQILWRMLALLGTPALESLRIDATHPVLAQWADLALISQRSGWNPHTLRVQLEQWGQLHPAHPAASGLIPSTLEQLGNSISEFRKVALLLPITSGFGNAAQAVYDGFVMMNQADSNPLRPQIAVYDTGENPELIGFYYEAAIREGAELVVGPLGKLAVDALVAGTELTVPTLLLGNSGLEVGGRRNVFQFDLSPEDEAREVAKKAFAEGHRVGAILYPESDWGIRQKEAFSEQWLGLGGEIAENTVFVADRQDNSQAIKLMFNIDESEARHRRLQSLSPERLNFLARNRQDLDFIFMIARSRHGRLLKPQINFHTGAGVPVYAISQIYSGRSDTVEDLDLDDIVFGDMPWLLLDTGVNRYVREHLPDGNSYRDQPLDRLFALGIDAYQLLFRLEKMKTNPLLSFQGATGKLSLAADGSILRQLEWAKFREGVATPIAWDAIPASESDGVTE
jgi:uncharacterized protein